MNGKRILMLIGEYSEEYEIFVVQQALEALGHTVDIICPETKKGDRVTTSVHDFAPGIMTWTEHKGHAIEVTQDFDATTTESYDSVYIAGGRGPEYIRTYERVREIVREFHRDDKPIAAICHGVQVLVAVPEVIAGKRISGLFTTQPEIALTDATYVPIGGKEALRDGNLVTAEGWTALAAFIREYLVVLGTEIVHHPIGASGDMAAAE
ncbi:DJ-1/PfpI family protein [Hoeflea sp. WL0058]|uniref:DJ-1/PfpI family protein n=1 Tax=Flavimaribacter sediminis TaxID=2865987 RepID=A0AAE3D350_9HYPH|nr:DJ-1/PfpI family protein [Flavimaribacter sediminis]MBW8639757.1 DJ-1/PfpI family protein [Flavimaribacter sediminis]